MLSEQQGRLLVHLARQTIEQHLGATTSRPVSNGELAQPGLEEKRGVFVTLHKRGDLRGCIGSLTAVEPIIDGIRSNALNAAFHDFRFNPVAMDELEQLHVEISVLTDPVPLPFTAPEELRHLLCPGRDGVILEGPGGASATFLPQVWEQLPSVEQFLGHLCRKAGLAESTWRSGNVRLSTYQVQSFEESR
ncbi:MAG: AmmeMemoRadiSam system protein A [Desulfobulbus sp.]|nr:AmmeMemoRadiSam system protein A [Desulfobulbus sp.]